MKMKHHLFQKLEFNIQVCSSCPATPAQYFRNPSPHDIDFNCNVLVIKKAS